MDPKLVASKGNNESEVKELAKLYKVPIKELRAIMVEVGENGKPERSREEITDALKAKGYAPHPRKRKKKDTDYSKGYDSNIEA
ncbi:hypothetical protein [Segetibacter aerophilus]|nr:hypothetical protein [Segetibacter aerophilus]